LAECASPDYDLVFVGGESRPVEIGRAGGRIYYLGTVPRVKMQEIYRAVDVFCLPSQGEGFPLTVQEAMASGLPVVTTDDEAYRPYEVPSDAICFVSPNQTELGRELRQLSDDAALRAELGCRAREYACSQFSWDVHATRLERLYQQVRAARAANQAQRTGRILRKWN
jgi:glycosyltransferase involved in cell wall biosynthesis